MNKNEQTRKQNGQTTWRAITYIIVFPTEKKYRWKNRIMTEGKNLCYRNFQ